MYRADSWSTAFFAIPLELEQDLFGYLCESFNPNTFLNTPQTANATVFKKPNISSQRRNTKKYKTAKKQQAETLKEQEEKQETAKSISSEKNQPLSQKQSAPPQASHAVLDKIEPEETTWNVLGDYFYPATVPGHLLDMRRFETKNKSKEIKINFSSKNKQPFLEKLQATHRNHPARQTSCADGSVLYETVSDGIYQAYLLSENATLVFSASYSLPTPCRRPPTPHACKKNYVRWMSTPNGKSSLYNNKK